VVHSTDDLWSHIAWSSTGFVGIVDFVFSGNSEISDSEVPVVLEDKVFWFKIPVYDIF
jgi:hypothetical protein